MRPSGRSCPSAPLLPTFLWWIVVLPFWLGFGLGPPNLPIPLAGPYGYIYWVVALSPVVGGPPCGAFWIYSMVWIDHRARKRLEKPEQILETIR